MKLFYCPDEKNICNKTIAKNPTTLQVCHYTILWNVKCVKSKSKTRRLL